MTVYNDEIERLYDMIARLREQIEEKESYIREYEFMIHLQERLKKEVIE